MPITILHGEHHLASRKKLQSLIDAARARGADITRFEAKRLTRAELELALGTQSMFQTDEIIIIEGLHSLSSRKKRNTFVTVIQSMLGDGAAADASSSHGKHLILWEKRKLTKHMQKQFPAATVEQFDISQPIFDWLDSLTGSPSTRQKRTMLQTLHQALETEDEGFAFAMLCRQVRLLLQAKEGSKIQGHPYVVKKVNRQARGFSEADLLELHAGLTELDYQRKTGQIPLTFAAALDQLLLAL